jgi:hypothetical protein
MSLSTTHDELFAHLKSIPRSQRPHGVTDRRLELAKEHLRCDDEFFGDIFRRHALADWTLEEMERDRPETYLL